MDRYAFALILLATSLFSLTPARADQAPSLGTISFHLIGQAISMNNTVGSLGSATLDLKGGSLGDGQGGLMMQNLTGNLQISSVNYPIFTGDGKSDVLGNLTMLGDSSSGELLLQGTIQHNSIVTTDPTLSRLASLAYLALSGNVMLSTASGSLTQLESNLNSTSTENLTGTDSAQLFSSSTVNFTSQSQIVENVTQSTTSVNQNASYVMSGQGNGTITTTQFNNQTITVYMSSTIANTTITQTTTTTVTGEANTQSSTTLSNSTITVTNSSSTTGP